MVNNMDVIEFAKSLGKAIQKDERYLRFVSARAAADTDAELQELIGEFNLKRINAQNEARKENADPEKIKSYDEELKQLYNKVMENENMQEFDNAQREFGEMMRAINTIIDLSSKGIDPDTINVRQGQEEDDEEGVPSCGSGSCAGCKGCR